MGKMKGHIGGLLVESLTKDQIVHLLDVLFSTIDINHYREMFEKADLDMAETIGKIVEMRDSETRDSEKGKPPGARIASDQRIIELWNSLWERWDSLIEEVGDEEGKYAVQEEAWEPAYFDGSALADDLEPIAADMLSLIDDVYDLVDNPDLFSEALDEIDSSTSSYPEEMGVGEGDGCTLGMNATRCVLKWLWLSSKNEASPGKAFLNKVFEIEDQYSMAGLNDKIRRSGLQKMDADFSLSTVMDAWKSNLRHIIPDPEHAHNSDYTPHAQWMRALYELSHDEYNSMLTQWQVKHKRRRNLWRDMKTQSLPI